MIPNYNNRTPRGWAQSNFLGSAHSVCIQPCGPHSHDLVPITLTTATHSHTLRSAIYINIEYNTKLLLLKYIQFIHMLLTSCEDKVEQPKAISFCFKVFLCVNNLKKKN